VSELPLVCLLRDITYYIIVDGYSSGDCGLYELHVDQVGTCGPFECDCFGQACNTTGGEILDPYEDEETGDVIYQTLSTTVFVGTEYLITDVNLCLDLTHTYLSDMVITLTSPSGTVVTIWNGQCGSADNMPCVHFDDEAGGFLSCPPLAGQTGWPWGYLSDFDGENAYGTWTLSITDYYFFDTGLLNFWCLSIDYDEILPVSFGSLSALAGGEPTMLVGSRGDRPATRWARAAAIALSRSRVRSTDLPRYARCSVPACLR
jgi:subtilisin-like proprotein convertase family protein